MISNSPMFPIDHGILLHTEAAEIDPAYATIREMIIGHLKTDFWRFDSGMQEVRGHCVLTYATMLEF